MKRLEYGESVAETSSADQEALDSLVRDFLGAFTNTESRRANVRRIYELALPTAVIVKVVGAAAPEIYSLQQFVGPRQELLNGGPLVDFEEAEVSAHTTISGNVAQRHSRYRKTGVHSGRPLTTHGVKVWQFVRLPAGWRLSALAWDDEPPA